LNLKSDFTFSIMPVSMLTHVAECEAYRTPTPRAMTRCECAGLSFQEIAARIETERTTLEEVSRRTGCGNTCTACLPDLARFVAARQK
jgi:bacterioferritin-associated ferredoxin